MPKSIIINFLILIIIINNNPNVKHNELPIASRKLQIIMYDEIVYSVQSISTT